MKVGQDGARTDDTASMKKIVVDMLQLFDERAAQGLNRDIKDNRGFYHPLTGKLLCPAHLDWADEELMFILICW